MSTVRVGLIQTWADESVEENVERTFALVATAAERGAEIVCLQELFRSRYFCQTEDARNFDLAEPIPGETTKRLGEAAKQHGITLLGSLFEKRAAGLFHNTSVLLRPDGEIGGVYRKMHIPDDPRFYEKFYFTPGDLGFLAHAANDTEIGMLVCWDQWFPEAARLTAMAGAKILFYPTAIGTWQGETDLKDTQHLAWQTVQRSHAITNGVFVVAVNRIGVEDELGFWGRSFVAGPDGTLLAEAGEDEAVMVVDCDLTKIDQAREGWPFFRDRRIDAYGDLQKRYRDGGHGV